MERMTDERFNEAIRELLFEITKRVNVIDALVRDRQLYGGGPRATG
jgi:hypothetical protein